METIRYLASSSSMINNRGLQKPNEDYVFIDEKHHIFILLDGITRVHQEYIDHPGHSAACDVNRIFAENVHQYLVKHCSDTPAQQLLFEAVKLGNQALIAYRQQRTLKQWQFYPGTLGIIGLLQGDRFYYLYVGDCLGTLIRNCTKLHFGQQGSSEALELMKISKSERYDLYCNHSEHPLGYGIFNGDSQASELFEQSCLTLTSGDTVILSTDGADRYIRYTKGRSLMEQTPEQMIAASYVFDEPPFAKYADDKAIIKITIL